MRINRLIRREMERLMKNKKGVMVMGEVPAFVILLVVIGLVLSLGSTIVSSHRDTLTADTYEYNASTDALSGLATFASWQNTIALVGVITLILGLVLGILAVFRGRQ